MPSLKIQNSKFKIIKAVIFDMDGLMFNSEDIYRAAIEVMGKERNRKFTDEIHQKMMGRAALEDVQVLVDEWGLNEKAEDLFIEREDLYDQIYKDVIKMEKGLPELLDILEEKGIRKVIATGSNNHIVKLNLDVFNLEKRFEFVISGEMVENGKPDPEMYLKATERLGLPPEECLVLEDSVNGVISGKAAGCLVYAVPNIYSDKANYTAADEILDDLGEVAVLFRGM